MIESYKDKILTKISWLKDPKAGTPCFGEFPCQLPLSFFYNQ